MLKKDIVITLDNGSEYGVTEAENINGIEYALMININNKKDLKICKVVEEDKGIAVIEISNDDLKTVYPIFYSKAKDYLERFMN